MNRSDIDKIEIPLNSDKSWKYRFFEMLPGALTFLLISSPFILSFINLDLAAFAIITYFVFWFLKALATTVRVIQGYRKMELYTAMDWQEHISDINNHESAIQSLTAKKRLSAFENWHRQKLSIYSTIENKLKPEDVIHVIIFPMWNETLSTLEPSVESILGSNYDMKKVWLLIAHEERGGEQANKDANFLVDKYGDKFGFCKAIEHPDGIENEVIGKGGNIVYAARVMMDEIKSQNIDTDKVMVTTLDSDNRPHPQYLANLTYHFCTTREPSKVSFQPIPLYTNNIWDAPAPMRVIAVGNSFFQVVQSVRTHLLRNFSSHAQPLSGLIRSDFWSVRTVVEDGHQFYRSYVANDGDYTVVPQFIPITQDAVLDETYRKTFKAQSVQLRRWAYGASDISYLAQKWWQNKGKLPFTRTAAIWFRLLDTHVSWSSMPIVLAISGWVPFLVSRFTQDFPTSVVAYRLPDFLFVLQTCALASVPITVYLSQKILPERPERYKKRRHFWMIAQWAWLPIASIGYGSFSALYSQFRLFIGKYMEKFDITNKHVKD